MKYEPVMRDLQFVINDIFWRFVAFSVTHPRVSNRRIERIARIQMLFLSTALAPRGGELKKHTRMIWAPQKEAANHFTFCVVLYTSSILSLFQTAGEAVLRPAQCEEASARVTNGIPPWAAQAPQGPALTPPTLWLGQGQYPGECV